MNIRHKGLTRKSLIWLSAAWMTSLAAYPIVAAEKSDKKDPEKISVTGTRIDGIDAESMQPISIITREDIELSGDSTVADVLRNSSFNSFGSWKGQSGFGEGASVSAEVDLRGVGATLVLLDGRRLPGVGYNSGETQDLNAIPLSIVERIEILRSGASAIYGSDAIAGVINIISKSEFDGAKISGVYEFREADSGKLKKYELTTGLNDDRFNLLVVYEHSEVDALSDAAVSGRDNGLSSYSPASTVAYYDSALNGYAGWYNPALCDESDNMIDTGFSCYYAYSNDTWLYPQTEQDSVLTKYSYQIDPELAFSMRTSFSRSKSLSRFAPTPFFAFIDAESNPELVPEEILNNIDTSVDPFLYIYHRSALLGNRDSEFVKNNFDLLLSLQGSWSEGMGGSWETNVQRTVTDERQYVYNLINNRLFDIGIANNQFDILNTANNSYEQWSQDAKAFYESVSHISLFDVKQYRTVIDGMFSGDLVTGEWGSLSYLFGLENETLSFEQTTDPESAQGVIESVALGEFINADRERSSYFTEWALFLENGFSASLALRYDKYTQTSAKDSSLIKRSFSEVNPMLTVSHRINDQFLVRGVFSEAFRAPSLKEMFTSQYLIGMAGYDYYYCIVLDNPSNDSIYCDQNNQFLHNVTQGGNPDLTAEHGDTLNLGVVWTPTSALTIEANYYDIEYTNKIVSIDIDQLLFIDATTDGGIDAVVRGDNQKIIGINAGSLNLDKETSNGIDVMAEYKWKNDIGNFDIDFNATRVLSYRRLLESSNRDVAGTLGRPNLRANLSASWSNDQYFIALRSVFIDGQKSQSTIYDDVGSLTYHNFQIGMETSNHAKFTLGVKNLFDKSVPYYGGKGWRNFDTNLYDPSGRTWFFKMEKTF